MPLLDVAPFQEHGSYSQQRMIRDLMDFYRAMQELTEDLESRLAIVEAAIVDHEARITALEP